MNGQTTELRQAPVKSATRQPKEDAFKKAANVSKEKEASCNDHHIPIFLRSGGAKKVLRRGSVTKSDESAPTVSDFIWVEKQPASNSVWLQWVEPVGWQHAELHTTNTGRGR